MLKIQYRNSLGVFVDVPAGRLYVLRSAQPLQLKVVSTSANPNYASTIWNMGGGAGQSKSLLLNANSTADSDAAARTVTATLGNETATVRVIVYSVAATVTPDRNSPVARTNPISLGVDERVTLGFTTTPAGLSANTVGGLKWKLTGVAKRNRAGVLKGKAVGNSNPSTTGLAEYIAPYTTDDSNETIPATNTKTVQLILEVDSGPSAGQSAVQLNIVVHAPSAVMVVVPNTGIHKQGEISAGFKAKIYLTPDSVNFETLEFREAGGKWTVHTGTFSHYTSDVHNPTTIGTDGVPIQIVNNRNHVGSDGTLDTVYTFGQLAVAVPPAIPNHTGSGRWRIYWQYRVRSAYRDTTMGSWIRFQIADHDVQSNAAGQCTQSKAGASITYALGAATTAQATSLGF